MADRNHGTAVLGIMIGADNAVGIIGIAPNAGPVRLASTVVGQNRFETASAISRATAASPPRSGDVLVIEVQSRFRPVEYEPHVYRVLRTAAGNGLVVCEAAGNGAFNLDTELPVNPPHPPAIIIGAAEGNGSNNRLQNSNYGSRVRCFAWGNNVVAAGYGDLTPGARPTAQYTRGHVPNSLRDTSAATAQIAGAALIIQGRYRAANGVPLLPTAMINLLSNPATGTPQGAGVHGNIGVMPNVRAILQSLGLFP